MSDTPKLADALPTADLLFDRALLERRIAQIAERIDADYAGDRPLYLTVMNGGMLFASQLALHIATDLEFDYLHATRYRGKTRGAGLTWLRHPQVPMLGRRYTYTTAAARSVLDWQPREVRDTIIDTGRSLVDLGLA